MGKSSTVPLDYTTLMKDIRAQGLKHALEKQPPKGGGMVIKSQAATYGQMHEGKALKKVVTNRHVSPLFGMLVSGQKELQDAVWDSATLKEQKVLIDELHAVCETSNGLILPSSPKTSDPV
jgi:adenylate kinase